MCGCIEQVPSRDVEESERPTERRQPRHLAAGAALSVIADVGPLVAAAALSIVLARVIGPSGNGAFALLVTLVSFAVLVCSLGLASGLTYEVSRGWSATRAFTESYAVAAGLGLLGAAAGFGFYLLTEDSIFEAVDLPLAAVALATIPALMASQFAIAILLGRERYEGYTALQLTASGILLVVAAGLAIPFELSGAVAGLAASGWITALVGAALLRRPDHHATRSDERLRPALRFGLLAWGGNLLQQVNYRFDLLILGAFATTAAVGVYSVALTLTSVAWVLPHGLQMVIFPRTASLDAAAESGELSGEDSDAAVARGVRHSVLLLVPAGLIVAVLLLVVPLVYGSSFDQTVGLGFVLLPGVLALGVGKVFASVVAGRGGVRYNLYTSAIAAVLTLALYFTLIPAYEEWGAAAASSISYLATAVISALFFKRALEIPLSAALIPTTADLRNYPEALNALRAHLRARRVRRRAV
jgi:O-antigen/teichoic acid export membrane protein